MKHFYRTFFCAALAALCAVLCFVTSFAADSEVLYDNGGVISFLPGSAYTATDLFQDLHRVMPGSCDTQNVRLRNRATDHDYVKVYLIAVPHNESDNKISIRVLERLRSDTRRGTLPELAWMNDFLSRLTLTVKDGSGNIISQGPADQTILSGGIFLGRIDSGSEMKITAELKAPEELDNAYSDRIGELDWKFVFEAYDASTVRVRKVWAGRKRTSQPGSVTVHLLRDGERFDEVQLSDANGWYHEWTELDINSAWTVEEDVPTGYNVSYTYIDGVNVITNSGKSSPPGPNPKPDPDPTPQETAAEQPPAQAEGALAQTGSPAFLAPFFLILSGLCFAFALKLKHEEK